MRSRASVSGRGLLEALGAVVALSVGVTAVFRDAGEGRSTGLFALLVGGMVVASIIERRSGAPKDRAESTTDRTGLGPWYLGVAVPGAFGTWLSFLYVGLRTRRWTWVGWGGVYLAVLLAVIYLVSPDAPRVGAGEGLPLGGLFLVAIWGVGILHACIIRDEVHRRFLSAQYRRRT